MTVSSLPPTELDIDDEAVRSRRGDATRRTLVRTPRRQVLAAGAARRRGGAPTGAVDSATRLLAADHREARLLFERYCQVTDGGGDAEARREVAEELCELLVVHAALEEEILNPAATDIGVDAALIDANAPVRVRAGVARVRALEPDDPAYDAELRALCEAVARHCEAEESGLFPACRAAKLDFEALAERLNERQAELLVSKEGRAEPAEGGLGGLVKKVFG
jgi:hypothetical protein